jgi:hypothetical protein
MPGTAIQTVSGEFIDPYSPDPARLHLTDIAHSLAYQCRYNGHIKPFYSVAQHSVIVAASLDVYGAETQLWGLLHDAAEAYLGDVAAPIKQRPEFAGFRAAEDRLLAAIAERFGLPADIPDIVREHDRRALTMEVQQLIGFRTEWVEWLDGYPALPYRILPHMPDDAETAFLAMYAALEASR